MLDEFITSYLLLGGDNNSAKFIDINVNHNSSLNANLWSHTFFTYGNSYDKDKDKDYICVYSYDYKSLKLLNEIQSPYIKGLWRVIGNADQSLFIVTRDDHKYTVIKKIGNLSLI